MKKYFNKIVMLLVVITLATSCFNDFPVDDRGLLITTKNECYISNFSLYDSSQSEILVGSAYIDTTAQVVVGYVRYGERLDHVWPRVSLCTDAILTPKITTWTDFTGSKMDVTFVDGDFASGVPQAQLGERIVANGNFPATALKYSVVSGTRKTTKEYTFVIVERPLQ